MRPVRRIVLVGFMGSGKSSVGPILARRLGWDFLDVDEKVERSEGRSVAAIFAESGEGHFRAAEARAVQEALACERVVLAPGGGWATQSGRLRTLPDGTRSIWLKVSPEEVVRRAARARGSRPLLAGPDPLARARELLAERDALYAQSDLEVDTEGRSVEDVAARILDLLGPNLETHPAAEKR